MIPTDGAPLMTMAAAFDLLVANEEASRRRISMIPSENQFSRLAKLPLVLDPYHRYFFNDALDPEDWRFGGSRIVGQIESNLTIPLLKQLLGAHYVNVRPISGLSAMTVALSAIAGETGNTVVTISPDQGGHYATGMLLKRLGYNWATVTGPDAFTIDGERLAEVVTREKPSVVYLDQSHGLLPIPVEPVVEILRRLPVRPHLHVDISHWLGLVLGGALPNPLTAGADSVGGSTHKTFPGPQKAVLATMSPVVAEKFRNAQFAMISSHHFAATLSLGLALLEFSECGGKAYAHAVVENAARFAEGLAIRGLPPIETALGYSAGHQVWIRTAVAGLDAKLVIERLYHAGIIANFLDDIPQEMAPALRTGLNEVTWLGFGVAEVDELANLFVDAALCNRPRSVITAEVTELRRSATFPFRYSIARDQPLAGSVKRLLEMIAEDLS
jgi:glycine hydroxymethyltransferase